MNRRRLFVLAALLLWSGLAGLAAQDQAAQAAQSALADQNAAPAAPDTSLKINGNVDVGYRFTDISGSNDSYRQLVNLDDGPRLMSLELHGDAPRNANSFIDSFWLSANGIGDPFTAVQLSARKRHLYDLRVNWRESHLFDPYPLTPASISGFDTAAVTDFHTYATTRQIGSAALEVDASQRLRFSFTFDRVQHSGSLDSTRSLDFLGSPSAWGAFARANPYPVVGPVNDSANRLTGGFAYSRPHWTITYKLGYQVFDEAQTYNQSASPERSINVTDPTTAAETLNVYSSSASRHLSAPVSDFSFVVRLSDRWDWRGEQLYSRYEGPFNFDAVFQGNARTSSGGTPVSPYEVASNARGESSQPSLVVGQGVTYRPFDKWAFDVDYRYTRLSSDATGTLGSLMTLYSGAPSPQFTTGTDVFSWRQSIHTADFLATFAPNRTLTLRPGVRLMRRDVDTIANGASDPATSGRETSVWPELIVAYLPSAKFSARGQLQSSHADMSFTRMSPLDRRIAHAAVAVKPTEKLSIEGNVDKTDADNTDASFVSHTRGASVQVFYAINDNFTVLGGLDYRSFTGAGLTSFLRGTTPISDLAISDEEKDRIWQAGLTFKPVAHVGITATGNYDRTTGTNQIQGEPPLYGPTTFPYGTLTAYYETARGGKISIDLQRTYWRQEILPMNDFTANLVMIRYSHGF